MQYSLIFARLWAKFQYVVPKPSHQQGSKTLASDLAPSQQEPALSVPMPSRSNGQAPPRDGPRGAPDGPRGAQDGPRGVEDGSKRAQERSKRPQDRPRAFQDGLRWPQKGPRGPRDSPTGLQKASQEGSKRQKSLIFQWFFNVFLIFAVFNISPDVVSI